MQKNKGLGFDSNEGAKYASFRGGVAGSLSSHGGSLLSLLTISSGGEVGFHCFHLALVGTVMGTRRVEIVPRPPC